MANRKDDQAAKRSTSSTRGGVARRGAHGDEPRTSASPAPDRDAHTGPSTQPVSEGLEGAILSEPDSRGDERGDRHAGRPTRDAAPRAKTRGKRRGTK